MGEKEEGGRPEGKMEEETGMKYGIKMCCVHAPVTHKECKHAL